MTYEPSLRFGYPRQMIVGFVRHMLGAYQKHVKPASRHVIELDRVFGPQLTMVYETDRVSERR